SARHCSSYLVLLGNARLVAKRLDLRGGLGATVGDDLLEHAKPRFDALHMLGILRAFLGREIALRQDLLLLDAQPHFEGGYADRREWDQDPNPFCWMTHSDSPDVLCQCCCS